MTHQLPRAAKRVRQHRRIDAEVVGHCQTAPSSSAAAAGRGRADARLGVVGAGPRRRSSQDVDEQPVADHRPHLGVEADLDRELRAAVAVGVHHLVTHLEQTQPRGRLTGRAVLEPSIEPGIEIAVRLQRSQQIAQRRRVRAVVEPHRHTLTTSVHAHIDVQRLRRAVGAGTVEHHRPAVARSTSSNAGASRCRRSVRRGSSRSPRSDYADRVTEEHIDFNVQVPPECQAGVWANFAAVSHSPYEFTLDFVRLSFGGPTQGQGVVVSRVNMSPLFVDQLIEALKENQARWLEQQVEQVDKDSNEEE
ncbi:MAG: DUF3467 domain-containing protein [Acidimicrobiales bacterium]|nr:DUF3467 domain-containing protein [Acidimicrobiales bacterium]